MSAFNVLVDYITHKSIKINISASNSFLFYRKEYIKMKYTILIEGVKKHFHKINETSNLF